MSHYLVYSEENVPEEGVLGLEQHNERRPGDSILEADPERTCLNFHLKEPGCGYREFLKARRKENSVQTGDPGKKETVLMSSVIRATEDFFPEGRGERMDLFFRETLSCLEEELGGENIVSAVVHMDEELPHMHLVFTGPKHSGHQKKKDSKRMRNQLYCRLHPLFPELEPGEKEWAGKHPTDEKVAEYKIRTFQEEVFRPVMDRIEKIGDPEKERTEEAFEQQKREALETLFSMYQLLRPHEESANRVAEEYLEKSDREPDVAKRQERTGKEKTEQPGEETPDNEFLRLLSDIPER